MLKRCFDVFFSLTVLLLLGLPFFILLALFIKLDSKGPLFYGSVRVGQHGRLITCWKFRTMIVDADKVLQELLDSTPSIREEWEQYYKLKNDIRITRVGRWLRKTSLDELPQFWNVLKGDLSVVGPRPVSIEEASLYLEKKGAKMFSLRPGLTGLWQTSGRSNLPYLARMDLEERYIDTRSFILDLWLILKTIPLMVFPKGAF